jgi:trehalose-6-phosphatase|tara:strand:+ start:6070 stop:6258 length:189 start_codon:yes stop_codon:yes gene_type:complete
MSEDLKLKVMGEEETFWTEAKKGCESSISDHTQRIEDSQKGLKFQKEILKMIETQLKNTKGK